MQKLSAKLSKEGPPGICEKGRPEATASFASPKISDVVETVTFETYFGCFLPANTTEKNWLNLLQESSVNIAISKQCSLGMCLQGRTQRGRVWG